MTTLTRVLGLAASIAVTTLGPASAQSMRGYLGVPNEAPSDEHGGGFSMYVAAWPLLEEWPGSQFQTGLFGTWMFAQKPDPQPEGRIYSDIEGGLGWWRDTRFATATPKFIMGGVALNFVEWANGPGAGKGRDWDQPKGKYAVAQLSPWVIWPPDGLNLAQGTCGELFGYGYLPLPLTDPKDTTAGHPVPTGNQCWTLFLNTANFKGPVAFFTPYFFSRTTIDRPDLAGVFLDASPAAPGRALQMETQWVPGAIEENDRQGTVARVAPTRFPANTETEGESMLVHRITSYKRSALWDGVAAWFAGGEAVSGSIGASEGAVHTIPGKGWSTWKISPEHAAKEDPPKITWDAFASPVALDEHTFGYRWDKEWVKGPGKKRGKGRRDQPLLTLPEHYELDTDGDQPLWKPTKAGRSGVWRALAKADFGTPKSHDPEPYVTPEDGCWAEPGPVAGPFEVELGDGSIVTYAWYRFADQPAILNADLTDAERETLQERVERLHRTWTREREYLPPPTRGELASLDAGLVVDPPEGLEIGYVPIVTKQRRD